MSILMVTGIEGARNCAAAVEAKLGIPVEVAEGRRAALIAMRKGEFAAVVVDESIAECDPAAAEAIWERAGLAIPLQINFALSGAARLVREIRAALHRRDKYNLYRFVRTALAALETLRKHIHRLHFACWRYHPIHRVAATTPPQSLDDRTARVSRPQPARPIRVHA